MIRLSILTLTVALCACAGTPSAPDKERRPSSAVTERQTVDTGQRIAGLASNLIGTPYRYGGSSPTEGFDCSGLVYYTHGAAGVRVPRTSRDQYRVASKIPLDAARPGDLVFFSDQAKLSHVAIYLGDGRFVHAPSSGKVVSEGRLREPYYRKHLVGLGRLYP